MHKILLIGSHLGYNLEHYVKIALENLGHDVFFFGYRDILGSMTTMVRMAITRSNFMRTIANNLLFSKFNERIKREAAKISPDLVLAIKGEALNSSTIEWIRNELGIYTA